MMAGIGYIENISSDVRLCILFSNDYISKCIMFLHLDMFLKCNLLKIMKSVNAFNYCLFYLQSFRLLIKS